jgi:hypothetical protein
MPTVSKFFKENYSCIFITIARFLPELSHRCNCAAGHAGRRFWTMADGFVLAIRGAHSSG